MTILLTLSSPQTIPSVLFIKQFAGMADAYYFMTTPWSEKQGCTEAIIRAAEIPISKCKIYTAGGEDVETVQQAIIDMQLEGHTVLANINGGTKVMAMGTFAMLSTLESPTEIYYLPLHGGGFDRLYPEPGQVAVDCHLSLEAYLEAHRLDIKGSYKVETIPPHLAKRARDIMKYIIKHRRPPKEIIAALDRKYQKRDKHFLLGGWLELYTAGAIKNVLDLNDDEIAYNVRLSRTTGADNEFTEYDVLYMYENKLHVVECKYFSRNRFSKRFIIKEWYKLAGLRQDFGITCKSFFVTANSIAPGMRGYLDKTLPHFHIAGAIDINTLADRKALSDFLIGHH